MNQVLTSCIQLLFNSCDPVNESSTAIDGWWAFSRADDASHNSKKTPIRSPKPILNMCWLMRLMIQPKHRSNWGGANILVVWITQVAQAASPQPWSRSWQQKSVAPRVVFPLGQSAYTGLVVVTPMKIYVNQPTDPKYWENQKDVSDHQLVYLSAVRSRMNVDPRMDCHALTNAFPMKNNIVHGNFIATIISSTPMKSYINIFTSQSLLEILWGYRDTTGIKTPKSRFPC